MHGTRANAAPCQDARSGRLDLALKPMSLIRASAWAASAAILITLARFALAAILARKLSLEGFGQYAYAQWVVDIAFLVCSLGVTGVLSRYLAEYGGQPVVRAALVRAWMPLILGLPVAGAVAAVGGMWLSGNRVEGHSAALLALWAIGNGLWSMQTAILIGLQRFDLVFRANLVAAIIMLGGGLLIPFQDSELHSLFGLLGGASLAASLIGWRVTCGLIQPGSPRVDAGLSRAARMYAFNIWFSALLWSLVWSRGELPIVRFHLGDQGVAHYAAAVVLFGGAMQGIMLAVSGAAPQLTALMGSDRTGQAVSTAGLLMNIQLLLCGLGALTLTLFGPEILRLAYGPTYTVASASLALLSLGLLGLAASSQNHMLQIATNARFTRNITLAGLVLLGIFAFSAVPMLGIEGAALARAATMLMLGLVSLWFFVRAYGGDAIPTRNAGAVTVVCLIGVVSMHMSPMIPQLPMRGLLYALFVFVLACLMRIPDGRALVLFLAEQGGRVMAERRHPGREA